MPAANSGWAVITPVEESVTFKMAHSQGSLPVMRNVYYGLWSHPVNVCECVFLHAHFSVSWRSVWVLKAIWLADMNLHFPFLLLRNVLQADVLCSCSRLHSNIFNSDFIDVLECIQGITSMNLWVKNELFAARWLLLCKNKERQLNTHQVTSLQPGEG